MPTVHAPPLPTDVDWLNVERPLAPEELLGRIVVLDFWTYCCINCLHTLPVLARLEKKLAGQPVAFIGVHSPKFPNERDAGMVREAVRRYGVTHPVVVDSGHRLWSRYAVRAWPTLVLVDPAGYVIGQLSGEPDADRLEDVLVQLMAQARSQGMHLAETPLPLRPEPAASGALAYPGKVLAAGGRLFVADTGHHQIVEVDPRAGGELRRHGDGTPGLRDGVEARFRLPNGMALDGQTLWVADTGNHALRSIDLTSGATRTVAGNGELGQRVPREIEATQLTRTSLRSPWDVVWDGERRELYVAMAGTHQIFRYDPAKGALSRLAGAGHEARADGGPDEAAFAQPSGLAQIGGELFVADSEISCVRGVDVKTGATRTVCGGDLFVFGDQDGVGDEVRLQHPLGICADGDRLLLADSFNHSVKEVDPRSRRVRRLYGHEALRATQVAEERRPTVPGIAGPDTPVFFEPEGLSVQDGTLYVADTNNQRIVAIDMATGRARRLFGGEDALPAFP